MTVFKWSTTAASNATIDDTINARENMAPSGLNDAIRGMMAAIAKWRADMSGNLVTAGSSTAYTLTTNQGYTALTDGIAVAARMDETNGAAPTLNVDSLGAKAIATLYGSAVGTGKLRGGAVYVFVYDSTDDKWIVQANPNEGFESGTKMVFRQTAAPTGWTKDMIYTDAALRVTTGTISEQATSGNEFSTLFAERTLARANLPNVTLSGTTGSPSSSTFVGPAGFYVGTGINLLDTGGFNAVTQAQEMSGVTFTHSHTHTFTTSSLNGNVTQTAMNFDVNFVDLIIATRD